MTPISIAYFILGLVSLYWPLATLFFKRRVLDAQWLMMGALSLVGLSIIIYSTFFNTFLSGEYMLVLLFMFLSLIAVPITHVAVTSLTRPQGVSRIARLMAIPSLVVIVAMFISIFIGTPEMYHLWIERGDDGHASRFFEFSWRYNIIVAIHYYLYWFVIVGELLFLTLYSVVAIHRFRHVLDEYFAEEFADRRTLRLTYVAIVVNCLAIVLSYIVYPFNSPRPAWVVVVFCIVEGVAMFTMGWLVYHISHGAENLREKFRINRYGRGNLSQLGKQIIQYVEKEQQYLNPDLSVFMLSEHFKVSQDDVVDAIHKLQGMTFGDYVEGLRIEKAMAAILSQPSFNADDPEQVTLLAHACGYLSNEALEHSFSKVMHLSLHKWVSG